MTDLETRLGHALDELAPSAALPDRIVARVAQRERRRRAARTGGSVLAAVALMAGVLTVTRGDGERGVVTDPQRPTFRWEALPPAPIPTRQDAGAVWTGSEVIVWGGRDAGTNSSRDGNRGDGAAYNPTTGRWRTLATAPIGPRSGHHAMWTGTEMLVWGGYRPSDGNRSSGYADGALYDPARDTWRRIADAPIGARVGAGSAWTGRELVVVGGTPQGPGSRTIGAAYDPSTGTWRLLADLPFTATTGGWAAWTGEVVLYWRGLDHLFAYDPAAGRWSELASPPEEYRLSEDAAVISWTGGEVLITWRGTSTDDWSKYEAIAYDPVDGRWRRAGGVQDTASLAVIMPSGVWTGAEQVALDATGHRASAFNPGTGDWYGLPQPPDGLMEADMVATDDGDVYVFGEEANAVLRRSVPVSGG